MIGRRPDDRQMRWPAVIHRCKLVAVDARMMLVRHLGGRSLHVAIPCGRFLGRVRSCAGPAPAAVITDAVDRRIPDDRSVDIGVVDDGGVDIGHGGVIPETATLPGAAHIPPSIIPTPVIDAAIEADMRTPVSGVPHKFLRRSPNSRASKESRPQ